MLPLAAASTVSGIVVSAAGNEPLIGATVQVAGTSSGTITDEEGRFSLEIDDLENAVLLVSYVGYETQSVPVAGRNFITIRLLEKALPLDEIVVTGYATQRKRDITGAVSVVDVEGMDQYKAPGFAQKLEGQVAGLQIYSNGGEPNSPINIRIRGISSFTNNDPLIIIDGVPVTDRFLNWLNPNDIAQIQVLKDASAASIYGSRANNGVIIIETKKGKTGKTKVMYDGYVGLQEPVRSLTGFLIQDPLDYGRYLWQLYQNAGQTPPSNIYGSGPEPVVPDYIWPDGNVPVDESTYSYPDNPITRASKEGTDWEKEVSQPGFTMDHNLRVSGGTEQGNYNFSFGYSNQNGIRKFNYLERFTIRINSQLSAGLFNFGENITVVSREGVFSEIDLFGVHPILPVYDIGGNFAGNKASGTGGRNPLAELTRNKDDKSKSVDFLGNIFAELNITKFLKIKTSLGFNYTQGTFVDFTFPRLETCPSCTPSFFESWSKGNTVTWTNTLSYAQTFQKHDLKALVGYEYIDIQSRNIEGYMSDYITTDINAWYLNSSLADPDSRAVLSGGDISRIASAFGKIDYQFDNKYLFSFTLRYDGSSKFGRNKYGTFPAANLGWRLSGEPFMKNHDWLTDLKLRVGVGVTGGQNIPSGNTFDRYGGDPADGFYDLYGTNNSAVTGYALSKRGNPDTRWERNASINAGLDFAVLEDRLTLVFDWYIRHVDGLLFNPSLPGTAGTATPSFVNIAEMRNKGVDVALRYRGKIGRDLGISTSLNLSHYNNEIRKIDGQSDAFYGDNIFPWTGTNNINMVGYPISGFYGLIADGIFQDQEEVDAHALQDGKQVGRLRFRDVNQDGVVNDEDRGVIGHPHPDLNLGFHLSLDYRNFDFSIFLAGPIGNQIYHYNRVYYEFGFFNANMSKEVLTNSWTPERSNARIPRLDVSDVYSFKSSTFYLEDGSYLRAKTILLGYSLPGTTIQKIGLSRLRVYAQVQNAFTITSYSGYDPAVPNLGAGEDIFTGYDFGYYPTTRMFSFGMNLEF